MGREIVEVAIALAEGEKNRLDDFGVLRGGVRWRGHRVDP